ncbi:sugar phosphate isomerase/epimerase [Aestuariivirga sp.]|uniref:sugar phosphate isomerase/epimerase family protein n=1 Tax=Aestuariivirga sp. TaxID=2650926 RepID=UPI0025C45B72|nr:sugar phosphate isomerase/epimerase [Aestuariivirga sp.]MCA3555623.1 sugar phosphate isomerase/epimerase [Aestuariivirga sp.]
MLPNGIAGTGISAHKRADDLSDLASELDMIEELGVESIELPTYDMDIVVGGRIRPPQLAAVKRACAGRGVAFTVHGPLALNFMDAAWRLPRHFEVLEASLDVAAAVGAGNYVLHAGVTPTEQAQGLESAYDRQREWLSRAGDLAAARGLTICVETLFTDDARTHTPAPARLARELAAIGHPAVRATIDFSHSYLRLDVEGRRADYIAEVAALAPFAQHLHIHDSFGRQDDIWMFTEGERLAFGHGDLHLPVGWGDIPWADLMAACAFPQGVVFNIELKQRYWYAAADCVAATRAMAATARTLLRQAAE